MNERFSRSGKDIEFEQFFYCEILIKIHELKDAGGGENGNHLINRIREDKMWNLFKWFWTSNTEEKLDIKERMKENEKEISCCIVYSCVSSGNISG